MPFQPPFVLTPCLPAELLCYILEQKHPSSLIVCGSRTAFLSFLHETTSTLPPSSCPRRILPDATRDRDPDSDFPPPVSPSHALLHPGGGGEEDEQQRDNDEPNHPDPQQRSPPPPPPEHHLLLRPTLYQLSLSRPTTLTYIPTVSHLRAYLSVFSAAHRHTYTPPLIASTTHFQKPLLIIYGLVELHRGTSEWSTQGLGSSCAALVEAGERTGRRVVVIEVRKGRGDVEEDEEEQEGDGEGDGEKEDGEVHIQEECEDAEGGDLGAGEKEEGVQDSIDSAIWHEKLPILSGSLRRPGAVAEYGGRTVEVGMVLRRWFKFGRGPWDDGGYT